jgi:hypothetical protein
MLLFMPGYPKLYISYKLSAQHFVCISYHVWYMLAHPILLEMITPIIFGDK